MLRATQDVVEIRRWAEGRGASPCRDPRSGRIWLVYTGEPCTAQPVGWDEFEATFCVKRAVFMYEDAPGSRTFFVGDEGGARRFLQERVGAGPAYAYGRI